MRLVNIHNSNPNAMTLCITLEDEHDILELYRLWAQHNTDAFRGDWTRVPRHFDLADSHHRCEYFERRRFRICKLTGQVFLHPHTQCPRTYDKCPFATETRAGDVVCAVTGIVLGPPRTVTAESLSSSLWMSSMTQQQQRVSRQDVERMNVDSPFYTKRARRVASFETVAGRVRMGLLALVHNLLAECFVLHNKEDSSLIENLACAFFFHTKQNITAFRRVTVAFLRIMCTHSPDSFPQLPRIRLDLFNVRNWRYVVGCEQKSITQTEKRVLEWLRTFQWTGEWLIRPDQIREPEHRYTEMLERCVRYESVSSDALLPHLSSSSSPSSSSPQSSSSSSSSSMSVSASSLMGYLSATTTRDKR